MTPQVNVLCTVRNGARTLPAVLDSLRAQSIDRWEAIIVDDGSKDDTPGLLRRIAREDPRFRVLGTGGLGRGPALNLALRAATAELVANVDADDPSHPRRLEAQVAAMELHPAFSVLGADTAYVLGDRPVRWPAASAAAGPPRDVTARLAYHNPLNHSSVIARRVALASVGGYDERRRSQFDYDLWVRLAAGGHRLGVVPAVLASKRLHPGQAFERRRRVRYLLGNARCQARAIRAVGAGPEAWMVLVGRVGWGVLPGGLRDRAGPPIRRWLGVA